MRLGVESDLFLIDILSLYFFSEVRSDFCFLVSDFDLVGQDFNINDNFFGNIMVWFYDMNFQSIVLIFLVIIEISVDFQFFCIKDGLEGVKDVELVLLEDLVFEDVSVSEDRGIQIEENFLEENILVEEVVF